MRLEQTAKALIEMLAQAQPMNAIDQAKITFKPREKRGELFDHLLVALLNANGAHGEDVRRSHGANERDRLIPESLRLEILKTEAAEAGFGKK
jgi:hypothetical protein